MDFYSNTSKEERIWAMLCHLAGLAFFIPLGNILFPLLVWMLKKDKSSFINDHGKEALNFQLSMMIYFLCASLMLLIIVGIPILGVLIVLDVIFIIVAGVHAFEGKLYRYPFCIRFIQ